MNEKDILMMTNSPFIIKLYETFNGSQSLFFLLEPALGGELYATYNRKASGTTASPRPAAPPSRSLPAVPQPSRRPAVPPSRRHAPSCRWLSPRSGAGGAGLDTRDRAEDIGIPLTATRLRCVPR